jgi:hypothetical protein
MQLPEYELQLETKRDGKIFVNPQHLPVEEVRLSEGRCNFRGLHVTACKIKNRLHFHDDHQRTKRLSRYDNCVMIKLTSLFKPTQFLILAHSEIVGMREFLGFTSKFAFMSPLQLSQ